VVPLFFPTERTEGYFRNTDSHGRIDRGVLRCEGRSGPSASLPRPAPPPECSTSPATRSAQRPRRPIVLRLRLIHARHPQFPSQPVLIYIEGTTAHLSSLARACSVGRGDSPDTHPRIRVLPAPGTGSLDRASPWRGTSTNYTNIPFPSILGLVSTHNYLVPDPQSLGSGSQVWFLVIGSFYFTTTRSVSMDGS
jgi:hypothetical protein